MSLFPLHTKASWATEASTGCAEEAAAPPIPVTPGKSPLPMVDRSSKPTSAPAPVASLAPPKRTPDGRTRPIEVQRAEAVEIEDANGGATSQQTPSALTCTDEDLLGAAQDVQQQQLLLHRCWSCGALAPTTSPDWVHGRLLLDLKPAPRSAQRWGRGESIGGEVGGGGGRSESVAGRMREAVTTGAVPGGRVGDARVAKVSQRSNGQA
jgi:hypothetical protein